MSLRLSDLQKKILKKFIAGIERRGGVNVSSVRLSLRPEQLWKAYGDDFADVNAVEEFERDVAELESAGLVTVERSAGGILRIREIIEKEQEYFSLSGVKQRGEKAHEELEAYRQLKNNDAAGNDITSGFIKKQIHLLTEGKPAEYTYNRAENIVKLLRKIEENAAAGGELLERELSMAALGDSKLFEKSYRSTICNILEKYDPKCASLPSVLSPKGRDREKLILEGYGISANPSYVYIKGDVTFTGEDTRELILVPGASAAVSAAFLSGISYVNVSSDEVMTVENITAFHRIDDNKRLCIYTGGYHGIAVRELLLKINSRNNIKKWLHFGDIDPDGFLILKNLRAATGLDIKPFAMGKEELEGYREFGRRLTEADRVKCENLLKAGEFSEVLKTMLEMGIKVEQEIIASEKNKKLRHKMS